MFTPIALKVNCGYARTAIRELTPKKKGKYGRTVDKDKRTADFKGLFGHLSLQQEIFEKDSKGFSQFDYNCDAILDMFSKKWNPMVRTDYEAFFSTENWKHLSVNKKKEHTLSHCTACSTNHMHLQEAFPGKPVFQITSSITLSLPETSTHSRKEKQEVHKVLGDLNNHWEECYGHSYSSVLPRLAPETNLTNKRTRVERKQEDRKMKRKITSHINQQLGENATLTVLAEAESLQAYRRKRFAMSFEKPTTPTKRIKLHSPSEDRHTWSHDDATALLLSHPAEQKINWSQAATNLHIPGKNAGQVLKEYAVKQGFNVSAMEHKSSPPPPRIRRRKKKLPGGEISTPSLPTPTAITSERKEMIACGKLSIGEPCSPYRLTKSFVTTDGDVKTKQVEIVGRKLSLLELRQKLINQHQKYMRLMTDQEINELTRENILQLMSCAHHETSPSATTEELQLQLATLQRSRTLAVWHDHSNVLQQGYILFAVWVIYDPAVYFTEDEYRASGGEAVKNLQEEIEQPKIHMIAPSTSSPSDQLALIGDRVECLQELSEVVTAPNGVSISDKMRFFCGDKPAQQFERGTQIGRAYKCGGCGCKDNMMQDLAHALQCHPRSLQDLQSLILAGQYGNQPGQLKPLEKLLVASLREELTVRGYETAHMLKPDMQAQLTAELKGAQRVPTLLVLDPTQSLENLHLQDYEVLDCEPLHDFKEHAYNLLQELPHLLTPSLKQTITQLIETTLQR